MRADVIQVAQQAGAPPLRRSRGPLSTWVRRVASGLPAPDAPPVQVPNPLVDDDMHLALHLLYDFEYRPPASAPSGVERAPAVVDLRTALEDRFWGAVCADVAADGGPSRAEMARTEGPARAVEALLTDFDGPSLSRHVETIGTRDELREFLVHRSAYQLKEADPHSFGLPRLAPGPRKSAYVEIQLDEYGEGRPGDSHAELFATAMREAGLDDRYGSHIDLLPGATLATGNLLCLFASRRELLAPLVGHLALFEMTSVVPMGRYAAATRRLGFGPAVQAFFDVHVVADTHHGQLARDVLLGDAVDGDDLDPAELALGAHALLRVEDRFARSLLDRWASGRTSLRHPLTNSSPALAHAS